MMRVRLKCYGVLRKYLPAQVENNTAIMEVPEGVDVAGLLCQLGVVEPEARAFVNGVFIQDVSAAIPDGAEVVLLIPTAGGGEPPGVCAWLDMDGSKRAREEERRRYSIFT